MFASWSAKSRCVTPGSLTEGAIALLKTTPLHAPDQAEIVDENIFLGDFYSITLSLSDMTVGSGHRTQGFHHGI